MTLAKDVDVSIRLDPSSHKHTEFIAFHRDQNWIPSENTNNKQELYCSRMTRLYNPQGLFVQGSTSFFTLEPTSLRE